MNILKNVLDENASYYQKVRREIISRLACLPKGTIKSKTISGNKYFYLQYRGKNKVIQKYIGKKVSEQIRKELKERKQLEKELKEVEESLALLRIQPNAEFLKPVREIIKTLNQSGLWEESIELIGSWAFRLYQEHYGVSPFPLRTNDLDFAIALPYKGKEIRVSELLKEIGFREGFNPDGSIYFYQPGLRIDFLVPEKGREKVQPVKIQKLSLIAQQVRFLELLFKEPAEIKISKGIKIKIPSMASFLVHKLIVFQRRRNEEKVLKDLKQIAAVAKRIVPDREEKLRLERLWNTLPEGWKKKTRKGIDVAIKKLPLEEDTWAILRKMF
jgi:hypothetical protein